MAATNRSKFAYVNYSDIQTLLDDGKLDAYDMVFAKDRNEYCIVSPELEIKEIRGRVYTFESVAAANAAINTNTDTYAGMVVAIKNSDGNYEGYIVNLSGNSFYVTAIKAGGIQIDYNDINNIPIKNIVANEKIYLYDLANGFYKVSGTYSICEADPTTQINPNPVMVMVRHDSAQTLIKIIDNNCINDYVCTDTNNMTKKKYLTSDDIEEYDLVTREEATAISAEVSQETMDDSSAEDEDIENLFNL